MRKTPIKVAECKDTRYCKLRANDEVGRVSPLRKAYENNETGSRYI